MSAWWRHLGAVLLVAVATSLLVPPRGAAAAEPVSLHLVSQSIVVPENGTIELVLDVSGAPTDGTDLVVTLNGVLETPRAGVQRTLQGDIETPIIGFVSTPLAELPRDIGGRITLTLPTVVNRRDLVAGSVRLASTGVYPLRVEVRSQTDDVVSSLQSFVVRIDDTARSAPPLAVATVLRVDGSPTLQPDGTAVIRTEDRERAQAVAEVLDANRFEAVTLAPRPDLLVALDATGLPSDRELLERLGAALGDRQVAAATYVNIDPVATRAAGLADQLVTQLRLGDDAVAGALAPAVPNRRTWVSTANLDGDALTQLRDLGVRQVVVDAEAVVPLEALDPATVSELPTSDGSKLPVAVADPALAAALEPAVDPVLGAYHLLAELAALSLELDEGDSRARGVVLLPRRDWRPQPVFLNTFLDVIDELPLVRAVDLDELFRSVPPIVGPDFLPVQRQLVVGPVADLGRYAFRRGQVDADLVAFGSVLVPPTTVLAGAPLLLATSLSTDLTDDERVAYLGAVDNALTPLRTAIEPIDARRITMASRRTEIPLTVRSTRPYPVRVTLRFSSPKLRFPEQSTTVTVDGVLQLRVPVEARATGTFPLTIEVLTPVGERPLTAPAQLTVRVAVLAGFGLLFTVGALLVLATWWAHHVRVARRDRRREEAAACAARHPSAEPLARVGGDHPDASSLGPNGVGHPGSAGG